MISNKLVFMSLARSRGSKAAMMVHRSIPALSSSTRWHNATAVREPALPETHTVHAVQTDMVRSAVKELLEQKEVTKTITVEQLQQSYQNFKSLLHEARLCIADCEESKVAGGDEHQREVVQASKAVDDAFAAYLDMLEEFQGCDEELRKQFAEEREESTVQLKALRNELDQILPLCH